jgi:hypothetical protein
MPTNVKISAISGSPERRKLRKPIERFIFLTSERAGQRADWGLERAAKSRAKRLLERLP